MNVVFLSPHFPPNFWPFCVRLREAGHNVWAWPMRNTTHCGPNSNTP